MQKRRWNCSTFDNSVVFGKRRRPQIGGEVTINDFFSSFVKNFISSFISSFINIFVSSFINNKSTSQQIQSKVKLRHQLYRQFHQHPQRLHLQLNFHPKLILIRYKGAGVDARAGFSCCC